jgi:hypothetical protein
MNKFSSILVGLGIVATVAFTPNEGIAQELAKNLGTPQDTEQTDTFLKLKAEIKEKLQLDEITANDVAEAIQAEINNSNGKITFEKYPLLIEFIKSIKKGETDNFMDENPSYARILARAKRMTQ